MWKTKGVTPNTKTIIELAKYFATSPEYLLGESDISTVSDIKNDDFEEGLKKLSDAARSALEPPKITETKEQLFNILEELSDEDLETLVKFAQFVKYQQQETQEAAEAPPATAGTDTPAAQDAPEGAEEGE